MHHRRLLIQSSDCAPNPHPVCDDAFDLCYCRHCGAAITMSLSVTAQVLYVIASLAKDELITAREKCLLKGALTARLMCAPV